MVSFAESSSGEDSVECDADVSSEEEKKVVEVDSSTTNCTAGNILLILSWLVNVFLQAINFNKLCRR